MPDPMEEIKLLESHYNATYEAVKEVWAQRNRVSLYAYLLALALISTELQNFLAVTVLKVESINLSRPNLYILGLLSLLGLWVLLTQRTLFLDKQYIYLDLLERQIEYLLGYSLIAREGQYYRLQGVPQEAQKRTPRFYLWYDCGLVILTLFAIYRVLDNLFCSTRPEAGEVFIIIGAVIFILIVLFVYFISRQRMKAKSKAMADLLFENLRRHRPSASAPAQSV